ncbi:MAG: hypothetical protein J6B87_00615 [Clostridia bacterium]|nr:hypothetical protein [Clostridia bacterium]
METNNNEMLEQNNMENENVVQEQNDVIQNETNNNTEQNNKNNLKILLAIFAILLVLVLGFVFAGSMFKSNEAKFFDLLLKKQAAVSLFEEVKNGQFDTTLEMDLSEMAESMGKEFDEKVKLELGISEVIKNKDSSGEIEFIFNDDSLITLDFAKTDDVYGVKVKDVTEKFIALQNKDLKDAFEKFEIDTDEIPDKFLTEEDFRKVMKTKASDINKMLNKYVKVLADNSKDAVKVEKNAEMKFGDEKLKTKKYTLSITEKEMYNIMTSMLEVLKEDEKNIKLLLDDAKSIIELMEDNDYQLDGISSDGIPDVEEVCEAIEEMYNDLKEVPEDYEFDDEEVIIKISVYEHKGKAIATEFEVEDEKLVIKTLVDKDLYIGLEVEEDGDEMVAFILKGTMDKNELDAEFIIKADNQKLELFNIKQKQSSTTKNLVKLDEKNALIANDADKDDLEEYAEEFMEGMEKITEDLQEKLPIEGLMDSMNGMVEVPSMGNEDYNFDEDYDIDPDFTYTPSYQTNWNDDVVVKEGVLADAQTMYNKIQIGESKESVIQKLGTPAADDTYSMLEFIEWDSNIATDMAAIEVILQDGKVVEKSISLYSSKYAGVLLGKETNATIENLENVISNIKEGMTLAEVEKVLGKTGYESSVDDEGIKTYTWCDKMEQTVDISFDEEGKVYYVGMIW